MRVVLWLIVCAGVLSPSIGFAQEGPGHPDRTLPWVTSEITAPRIEFRTLESRVVGTAVSYHIYTPAIYDQSDLRLPVVYWLHGTDGGLAGIRPLARYFDEAMTAGKIPPMIVVFVNGLPRRLWANSKDGSSPVETVFVTEVVPDVDRHFRTIATRQGRVLEGFSMGGYGAARLGMTYAELFAGISMLAAGPLDPDFLGPRARRNPQLREQILRDVCGNDPEYFKALSPWTLVERAARTRREQPLVIRQVVGSLDETRDMNRRFHEHLTGLKIGHHFAEVPGVGHDAIGLLTATGEDSARFYRAAFGLAGDGFSVNR